MVDTAIVGSGPYGLSIAAYFRRRGISFRIFGRLMDSWNNHMPNGMCLKSDGFASNIYDPESQFTLERFCTEKGIDYANSGVPVKLSTFCSYGSAFQKRMVPEFENKLVDRVEQVPGGFRVTLEDGETFSARRVVLAVGITHFASVPAELAHLSSQFVSHSSAHRDLEKFFGRTVAVIGGGSSATDLAGLLHQAGADVHLVSRQSAIKFHGKPKAGYVPSLWQKLKRPQSGIGPGWRFRLLADAPGIFHLLPAELRLKVVRRALGPSGAYFAKDLVVGKVPMHLGCKLQKAEQQNDRVHMTFLDDSGNNLNLSAHHVVAATGYKVNLDRLQFLGADMKSQIECAAGSPILSSHFESSLPGLYFAGLASANSFGPVMRFAFGAGFAARAITRSIGKTARLQDAPAKHDGGKRIEVVRPEREAASVGTTR